MKYLSAILLVACLGLGVSSTAQALPVGGMSSDSASMTIGGAGTPVPYHRCHGASAGTADAACGSLTGGPSGGLF